MKPDLDAIRARCDAATPGPWKVQDHDGWYWVVVKDDDEDDGWMPDAVFDDGSAGAEYAATCKPHDREFLVAARTDIPALLAYIDELERINGVNNRIIVGLLSTIESMSTVDASYDDDEP